MKPTVIANANANASASAGAGPNNAPNGITIPINHEYHNPQSQHPQYQTHAQHYVGGIDPHSTAYGSPGSQARVQQQQQQQYPPQQPLHAQQQQQIPAHFQQDFGFDPEMDMDMDMFPRSRLRMGHDPFADFGASRKRSSLHDPPFQSDVFSRYFNDDPDFGFPQFNSLGRRRANNPHHDDDFFNRLPNEFRQYIPDSFGHRRTAGGMPGTPGSPGIHPQQQQQQQQQQPPPQPQQMPARYYQTMPPQSPSKKVCDAAIQTEDPNAGRSEVDHAMPVNVDNLNQHGLRNTMDMGVKSAVENEPIGMRSHSAPPNEPLQQKHVYHPQQQQQQVPVNGQRQTPPVQAQAQGGRPQFGTQTSPPVQGGGYAAQATPPFQKAYYAPQSQAHPQQKQQTPPPPQTPGGSYIRTIPIFVEGRSEPIINNKEIPNQNAPPSATARAYTPPKQTQQQQSPFQYPQPQGQPQQQQQQQHTQQHRPTPLNTQQQPTQQQQQSTGLPPQTPHTVDSINKIQDIQRDVLELMSCVEKFAGTRSDKEYAYLDEMLTRNLLKLDNIDTNGKESIRLARKEAIKCIQASINVLEAKAEENAKAAEGNVTPTVSAEAKENPQKSSSGAKVTKDSSQTKMEQQEEPVDASKIQEPIPLPPPEGMVVDSKNETTTTAAVLAEDGKAEATVDNKEEEAKPEAEKANATAEASTPTNTTPAINEGEQSKDNAEAAVASVAVAAATTNAEAK
ncbi:BAG domain-containing protein Samui isoform X1 [Stomoxys calcitrans]|uniref:BAG domain-containing protein Samui isoform X1 n=1 Tax=Stomoxys calcitrans TaxID=35570 RepID=UPI0027E2CAB7|nr:BAG domain-containing protein Samui isoform X1 [Stomoxys calcitrans]